MTRIELATSDLTGRRSNQTELHPREAACYAITPYRENQQKSSPGTPSGCISIDRERVEHEDVFFGVRNLGSAFIGASLCPAEARRRRMLAPYLHCARIVGSKLPTKKAAASVFALLRRTRAAALHIRASDLSPAFSRIREMHLTPSIGLTSPVRHLSPGYIRGEPHRSR